MVTHTQVPVGEVTLHVAEEGEGPPVVLLHGFPDFWYGWRYLMPALAEAGLRAIAPDQRGYAESDRPRGVAAYARQHLVGDVIGLLDALGIEKARVVGHDWGGGVAWWVAETHPERVERLVVINCPHPAVLGRAIRTDADQLKRSWYTLFFQLPWLPEKMLHDRLERVLMGSSNKSFTPEDLALYRKAFQGPLHGPLNWYRAAARRLGEKPGRIRVPALLVWGERDLALGTQLIQPTLDLCDDARVVRFPDLSHWAHVDDPGRVDGAIVGFLSP